MMNQDISQKVDKPVSMLIRMVDVASYAIAVSVCPCDKARSTAAESGSLGRWIRNPA
jgi:hypothetical protein